jgi:arylsulfatase A
MAPLLTGRIAEQGQHEQLYWEAYNKEGQQALRRGKWKTVRIKAAQQPNGPVELYDLETDVGETTDLAVKYPELAEEMSARMAASHRPNEHYALQPVAKSGKKQSKKSNPSSSSPSASPRASP